MNYIAKERDLVKNLDPFFILCHFFERYSKARPTTEMIVDLWSKEMVNATPGIIHIPPFDEKIKHIRVRTSERDPNVVEELMVQFPKKEISLEYCQERYGFYTLEFDPDTMISTFSFDDFRSIYIDKINFRYHGKFSETETGDFAYIHPTTFKRRIIDQEHLLFKNFGLHFRSMKW